MPQASDVEIFVKPDATKSGKAAAVITFLVQLPNGQVRRSQAVVTAALLETAASAVSGWRKAGVIK